MVTEFEPFAAQLDGAPDVRGYVHLPQDQPATGALVLAHGAGADARAALLASVARTFAGAGYAVLRCDLPFRQARPAGPPRPSDAPADRDGLRHAVLAMRRMVTGPVYLGGHSYGGRQATLLAAAEPGVSDALLLLSYPLHPPRHPENLRTAHFGALRLPALFVHGARDPFGSPAEMRAALALVRSPTELIVVPGGHDLRGFSAAADRILTTFAALAAHS
jgi:predicted alpha/beta-hydrolase family hydrolase